MGIGPLRVDQYGRSIKSGPDAGKTISVGRTRCTKAANGYPFNAGQLRYDSRYSKIPRMPVARGCGFKSLEPLWHMGVPPYVGTPHNALIFKSKWRIEKKANSYLLSLLQEHLSL